MHIGLGAIWLVALALSLYFALGCAKPCPERMTMEPNSFQTCECQLDQTPMCVCWEEPFDGLHH